MIPNSDGLLDLAVSGGLVRETGFETAVLTSLLLNRRAAPEDALPYGYKGKNGALMDDRQGWVGDVLDAQGRLVGSRLWLLDQELATEETRKRAVEYVREALQWTIDDGHVRRIDINAEWGNPTRLDMDVDVHLASGDVFSLRVNYESGVVHVV